MPEFSTLAAVDLLVCPPATLIAHFAPAVGESPVRIGAQDCHAEPAGPFTADGLKRVKRLTDRLAALKAEGVLSVSSVTNVDSIHEAEDGSLETELLSHYFQAELSRQFDAWIWFAETQAVAARPVHAHGPDETYPFGL